MNPYLLHFVGKWVSLLIVSITSLFGTTTIENVENISTNTNFDKSVNRIHKIVEYETIIKRNPKLPQNTKKVIVEGQNGIIYENPKSNEIEVLREVVDEVIEIGTGPNGSFVGRLTGYGADCKGCSGNVACPSPLKKYHNIYEDGIFYNDSEYGEVRILAASHKVFRCGTIIEVTRESDEPFIGIVLDTGSAMRNAWDEEEKILIDLAFSSESDPEVFKTTSNNVKYEVLRWGW